jgi:hypothetical protein
MTGLELKEEILARNLDLKHYDDYWAVWKDSIRLKRSQFESFLKPPKDTIIFKSWVFMAEKGYLQEKSQPKEKAKARGYLKRTE